MSKHGVLPRRLWDNGYDRCVQSDRSCCTAAGLAMPRAGQLARVHNSPDRSATGLPLGFVVPFGDAWQSAPIGVPWPFSAEFRPFWHEDHREFGTPLDSLRRPAYHPTEGTSDYPLL